MIASILLSLLCLNCHALELRAPSSRILLVSYPFQSHLKLLISIARALPPNHQVSFAMVDENIDMVRNKLESYRSVTFVSLGPLPKFSSSYDVRGKESNLEIMNRIAFPDIIANYKPMHDALLTHLQTHSYDMMVVNMFCYAAQDLAHDLKIPLVILTSMASSDAVTLPAWVPRGWNTLTQQQLRHSFVQRFYNQVIESLLMVYYFRPHMYQLSQLQRASNRTVTTSVLGTFTQHWDRYPILVASPLALEFRRSYTPNYHFLGFLLENQEADRMKTDVQSHSVDVWLNETKVPDEFVVVVAFGTLIKLPEKIWQTIADTLQLVPQMRLLLVIPQDLVRTKIETSVVSALDQPSRVFISGWIPQQRVLAHPSVRMFITHGGLNSIGEAVYTHVPLIIIPGYGDQLTNAAKVQESNIGYMLERHQITTARLADTIKLLHADHDRFVVNLRRIHQLCLMEGGAERASTLIDGWLLTGYDHEITLKHKLPFLVATSLDVQLTLFVFIILTTYLIFRVSKFIVYLLCPYKKYKRE